MPTYGNMPPMYGYGAPYTPNPPSLQDLFLKERRLPDDYVDRPFPTDLKDPIFDTRNASPYHTMPFYQAPEYPQYSPYKPMPQQQSSGGGFTPSLGDAMQGYDLYSSFGGEGLGSLFGGGSSGAWAGGNVGAAGEVGSVSGMGGGAASSWLGPAALIAGGKLVENKTPNSWLGRGLLSGLGPSFAQIKEDPKLGLTTALGVPFLNGWIRSDKAAETAPEWAPGK